MQRNSGKWTWEVDGRVCMRSLLLPKVFLQDSLENVAPQDQPKAVGNSYILDPGWGAEREYGKTIIEVNGDLGENFVMTGPPVH